MARGAAASEPGAETDQQAGRDDYGPARRQFGRWHSVTYPACEQRRQDGVPLEVPLLTATQPAESSPTQWPAG